MKSDDVPMSDDIRKKLLQHFEYVYMRSPGPSPYLVKPGYRYDDEGIERDLFAMLSNDAEQRGAKAERRRIKEIIFQFTQRFPMSVVILRELADQLEQEPKQ